MKKLYCFILFWGFLFLVNSLMFYSFIVLKRILKSDMEGITVKCLLIAMFIEKKMHPTVSVDS